MIASMIKNKDKFCMYILWITKSYNALKSHKKHAQRTFSRMSCRFIYFLANLALLWIKHFSAQCYATTVQQ